MAIHELLEQLKTLVSEVGIGILTTIDEEGRPYSRWMTPVFIPRLPGSLYAVTSRSFKKADHIEKNSNVSWIFQSRSLDRIGTIQGKAEIIRDPSLSAEVIEAIGPHLTVFWKYSGDPSKLVVVETRLERVSMFTPLGKGVETAEVADE